MGRKRLIYIIGAGRSGTTILDIVLGNAFDAISLGEINRFYKRRGIPPRRNPDDPVSCFWSQIRKDFEKAGPKDMKYEALNSLSDANEYHKAIVKAFRGKTEPAYECTIRKFYEILVNHVSQGVLIESSKYPLRALNISRLLQDLPIGIDYVYLRKDPVKVVRSFQKKGLEQPPKGYLASNLYYFAVNFLCVMVTRKLQKKGHKVSRVSFEELTSRPLETIARMGHDLHINLDQAGMRIEKGFPLQTGFLFDGNRIRLNENIQLKVDKNPSPELRGKDYLTRAFNFLFYRK